MHGFADDNMSLAELAQTVLDYSRERLELDPVPLDRTLTPAQLQELGAQLGADVPFAVLGGTATLGIALQALAAGAVLALAVDDILERISRAAAPTTKTTGKA